MKAKLDRNVIIGKNACIDSNVEIGKEGKENQERKTIIGDNCIIRSGTVIYAGTKIGDNFQTGHNVLIRENNEIGNNVSIGSNTEVALRNKIGDNTRIHSGCFLEDVILGNNVFVGPHVLFTNDSHPSSPQKGNYKGAEVLDYAIIGGGATILPYIKIGLCSLVGAGSVVSKNVGDYEVVVGNPARKIKTLQEVSCKRHDPAHKPYENYPSR